MKNVSKANDIFNVITNPVSGLQVLKGSGGGGATLAGGDSTLARVETEAEIERKRLLSEQAARQRAARRGGYRALLSQQRLAPETGLQTTLGVG